MNETQLTESDKYHPYMKNPFYRFKDYFVFLITLYI